MVGITEQKPVLRKNKEVVHSLQLKICNYNKLRPNWHCSLRASGIWISPHLCTEPCRIRSCGIPLKLERNEILLHSMKKILFPINFGDMATGRPSPMVPAHWTQSDSKPEVLVHWCCGPRASQPALMTSCQAARWTACRKARRSLHQLFSEPFYLYILLFWCKRSRVRNQEPTWSSIT